MTFVTVHRGEDGAAIQLNAAHIVSMEGDDFPPDRTQAWPRNTRSVRQTMETWTRLELFGGSSEPLHVTETPAEIEAAILELEERERVRREAAFSPDIAAQIAELFHAIMDSPGSPRNPLPVPTEELFRITCPGCGRQTEPGGTLDRIVHNTDCPEALDHGWAYSLH